MVSLNFLLINLQIIKNENKQEKKIFLATNYYLVYIFSFFFI
jgi:hypothetical protein